MEDASGEKMAMAPRARAIYDNCRVLDIDGELLFRAGRRRLEWYLARGLARRVDGDTIQLTFANKGTGRRGDAFYLQDMRNECVVCGAGAPLTMHHVVPHQYRQFMEEAVKSRSSHDLLPVCVGCHERYEAHAVRFKQHLARCFAAPLEGEGWVERADIARARRAAAALLSDAVGRIPPARIAELRAAVDAAVRQNGALFSDGPGAASAASDSVLRELLGMPARVRGPAFRSHGEIVVGAVAARRGAARMPLCAACRALVCGGVAAFSSAWRSHFVEHARPAHLPAHWNAPAPGSACGAIGL
ncbi:hypothetical protein H4R18_001480 [Coemansia javaensis]|uniref:HNH domain-containing protein n=1 Tax=Coemansia javaensis TaxID=2761396 RepID=A0A9W8LLH3_9FUNG|nr:hypothetical protein H4R18_001480 [Coemansia javaensis]